MRILFVITLFFFVKVCYSQSDDIIATVLRQNLPNKTRLFDSSNKKNGVRQFFITYLGKVTSGGKEFKLITSKIVWGTNKHNSGVILIYDKHDQYFGKYVLGDGLDLPAWVKKNKLVFTNKYKKECDSTLVTKIDLSMEIPREIFIRCKGKQGDIYSFSKSEK